MTPIIKRSDPRAFVAAAAAVYITCPDSERYAFRAATATNISAGTVALTLWVLPVGVAVVSNVYKILDAYPIAAQETYQLSTLLNQALNPGETLWALAGTASTITMNITAVIMGA